MKAVCCDHLRMQGFSKDDLNLPRIDLIARWTPFACALFGTVGLIIRSPVYFFGLGLLTSVGAFTRRSGYDLIYNLIVRHFLGTGKAPLQGNQRRLGCGIGAAMYIFSGLGFHLGIPALALGPALMMIVLGGFAAATQICFASLIYNGLSASRANGKNPAS